MALEYTQAALGMPSLLAAVAVVGVAAAARLPLPSAAVLPTETLAALAGAVTLSDDEIVRASDPPHWPAARATTTASGRRRGPERATVESDCDTCRPARALPGTGGGGGAEIERCNARGGPSGATVPRLDTYLNTYTQNEPNVNDKSFSPPPPAWPTVAPASI